MFENVELGHRLDKETYRERSEAVRLQLLDLEYRLVQERSFATLILINGVDKAGKGETMNLLNSWLDPRHLDSHAIDGDLAFDTVRGARLRAQAYAGRVDGRRVAKTPSE